MKSLLKMIRGAFSTAPDPAERAQKFINRLTAREHRLWWLAGKPKGSAQDVAHAIWPTLTPDELKPLITSRLNRK